MKAFDEGSDSEKETLEEANSPKKHIDLTATDKDDLQVLLTPIDSRMKALNYLGSLLSQDFVKIDLKTWLKCIDLIT